MPRYSLPCKDKDHNWVHVNTSSAPLQCLPTSPPDLHTSTAHRSASTESPSTARPPSPEPTPSPTSPSSSAGGGDAEKSVDVDVYLDGVWKDMKSDLGKKLGPEEARVLETIEVSVGSWPCSRYLWLGPQEETRTEEARVLETIEVGVGLMA